MKGLEEQLKKDCRFEDAVFLDSSRNYKSYLKNSVYLVLKNGKRWAISAGNAFKQWAKDRIIKVLECTEETIEEAKKLTQQTCIDLCSNFADDYENDVKCVPASRGHEGRIVEHLEGDMVLIQKSLRH